MLSVFFLRFLFVLFFTYLLTAMRFVSRFSLAAGGKALRRWYAAEGPRRPSTESVRPHPLLPVPDKPYGFCGR